MPQTNLPLPQFYAQVLTTLVPIFDDTLSTSLPSTQDILRTAIDNLYLIQRMLTSLGVFSNNESIDELGDGEIVFMTVGWVLAEAEGRGGLAGREDRINSLRRSEAAMNGFLSLLSSYSVLSEEEQVESMAATGGLSAPRDPGKRREAKIRQYKREKELREKISAMTSITASSPVEIIISLLAPKPIASTSVNPEATSTREASLMLLHLLYTTALTSLASNTMELSLLAEAPASISEIPTDPRETARDVDDTWRLDRAPGQYQPRELISGGGKVLRPFTILPSTKGLSERARLQSEVFRDGRRLPTMTIDEYLEEERGRGNIITGGGQASYDAPTASELLELAAENDGTMEAEEKGEEKRLKEENWAQYTEANPRGAGNTMNRG